ncbi:MAG: FkbM family methyltransferase, partial [Candidatus Nanohaloarchaea archaeon]|nr:FkbM family methyltransferase [Candidatus Nanohaloarchaea archaeon]
PISNDWFFPRYADGTLHEPALTEALLRSLSDDSVFYDVGSNVGYFTVFAANRCTDGAVYAFDIHPKLIEATERSLDRNEISCDVETVRKAVSDTTGETVSFEESTVPIIDDENGSEERLTAETVSLDDFCTGNPSPDVLKVDVEGYEYRVIDGAQDILDDTRLLFLEVHPRKIEQLGDSLADLATALEPR